MPTPWPEKNKMPIVNYRYRIVPGGAIDDGVWDNEKQCIKHDVDKDAWKRYLKIPDSTGKIPANGNITPAADIQIQRITDPKDTPWRAGNALAKKVMNPRLPVIPYGRRKKGFGWELIRNTEQTSYGGWAVVMQLQRAAMQGKVSFYGWDKPGEWHSNADVEELRNLIVSLKKRPEPEYEVVSAGDFADAETEVATEG